MNINSQWFVLVIVILSFVTGCGLNDLMIDSDTSQTLPGIHQSPITMDQSSRAVDVPVIPTSNPALGQGIIVGTINWSTANGPTPAIAATLYLGPILYDSNGKPRLASLDVNKHPKTQTNDFGQFIFTDVEPGEYGIFYSLEGLGEVLLEEPETKINIVVEVKADEFIDYGNMEAKFPLGQ